MHMDHHPPISLDSCGSSATWDNNYSRNRRSTGVVHPHEEAQQVPLAKRRKLEHSAAPTPGTATAPFWRGSVQDDRYYIVTPTPPFDADDVDVEMMDKEQHQQEAVEVPSIQRCGSDIVQTMAFENRTFWSRSEGMRVTWCSDYTDDEGGTLAQGDSLLELTIVS